MGGVGGDGGNPTTNQHQEQGAYELRQDSLVELGLLQFLNDKLIIYYYYSLLRKENIVFRYEGYFLGFPMVELGLL